MKQQKSERNIKDQSFEDSKWNHIPKWVKNALSI